MKRMCAHWPCHSIPPALRLQLIQHEIRRKELLDKQQRKIDELERRAQDMVRQKEENEAAWITKQREIELQKLRQEQELEVEAKRLAEERFKKEREMQNRLQEEERQRKKEAYLRWGKGGSDGASMRAGFGIGELGSGARGQRTGPA